MFCFLAVHAQNKIISRATYRDKTLAMVIGSIGGALTGYEYLNHYDTQNGYFTLGATRSVPKMPLLGLPDSWFILMNGTLGGTTKDEYNYAPWIEGKGKINSDDDQHIDFFNQYLLNKYGLGISYEDIKNEWMSKQVSDFGGGQGAIEVMRDKNLMAPQCGHRDHGNTGHWLPECYIEHEMMGAAFPGMPKRAIQFTEKFSHMTGEGEAVTWGYYWAAAHSIAFFESDIRVAVRKAIKFLPGNSRPRQMYDICVMLKNKYPNDWRAAVRELWSDHWSAPFAVGYDGVMMLSDVNNGTAFLSILYGNNDYLETLKISSLAGGDGDCTASAVGGLLGIIKGMAGTPQKFKDDIYDNGNGIWINDIVHAFSIKKDYQINWKYDQIVDMYMRNAETSILAYGGVVSSSQFSIVSSTDSITKITSNNWDFETGDLSGWKTWTSGGSSSIWNEKQCNSSTQACFAATGKYKGTILTNSPTSEAKLYQTITGLKPNTSYKIEGRINTAKDRVARLYVDNYGGPYKYCSIYQGVSPFPYMYLYITTGSNNTTLDIGLHAPPTTNASTWCSIDDIIITEVEHPTTATRYEAEKAIRNNANLASSTSASNGSYVGWINEADSYVEFNNIVAAYEGEYIVRINYANGDAFSTHKIDVNGRFVGLLEHSDTGPYGVFSANYTDAYVKLNKGINTLRISHNTNFAEIDHIDVISPYGSEGKPTTQVNLIDGGIYKITAKHSGKVLDINGTVVNGDKLVQNTYDGSVTQYFKVNKADNIFYITPLNSTLSVEILGASTNNGDAVGLWGYWSGDGQQWAIVETSNGYFKILNYKSGKAMDVSGGSLADNAAVIQWDYLGANNQQWGLEYIGSSISDLPHLIPGKIEAEQFRDSLGVQTENCTDIGGGKNVAFIENNDWVTYKINVATKAVYNFDFRVASATSGGKISVFVDDVFIKDINVSGTSGWQNWNTVSSQISLDQGLHTLKLLFVGTGSLFNINWINTTSIITNLDTDETISLSPVYPNPTNDIFTYKGHKAAYQIVDLLGKKIEAGAIEMNQTFGNNLKSGIYVFKIFYNDSTHSYKIEKK